MDRSQDGQGKKYSHAKIKICGLRRKEDIEMVNALLPEYIGFVFAKSKRQITIEQARLLKKGLDHRIQTVGVFVNQPVEWIVDIACENLIDLIQLHGQETEEMAAFLKRVTGKPLIKAVKVSEATDWEAVNGSCADYLLLDSGAGTGRSFDWEQIEQVTKPWFLAGGIGSDNIEEAMALRPYGIDVSSKVETDGYKDKEKVRRIIEQVHTNEWKG